MCAEAKKIVYRDRERERDSQSSRNDLCKLLLFAVAEFKKMAKDAGMGIKTRAARRGRGDFSKTGKGGKKSRCRSKRWAIFERSRSVFIYMKGRKSGKIAEGARSRLYTPEESGQVEFREDETTSQFRAECVCSARDSCASFLRVTSCVKILKNA